MNINEFVTDGKNYVKKSVIVAIYDQRNGKCSIHLDGERAGCFVMEMSVEEAARQAFEIDGLAPEIKEVTP